MSAICYKNYFPFTKTKFKTKKCQRKIGKEKNTHL